MNNQTNKKTDVFEVYLNKISSLHKNNEPQTGLELCEEMKARLLAEPDPNPFYLGWQRYYKFIFLIQLEKLSEALSHFLSNEEIPYLLDVSQTSYMTSVAAELAAGHENIALTLKLSRLAWALAFRNTDIVLRIQKAQNACIYFERLNHNRLNFCFARFLTGFGQSNKIFALFIQGIECLLANYRQSKSPSISALLQESIISLQEHIHSPPENVERTRILELIDQLTKLGIEIPISGKFTHAKELIINNKLAELQILLQKMPSLIHEYDKNGITLLFEAIKNDKEDIAELLIEECADIHHFEFTQGQSPLLMAVNLGRTNMVRLLIENGADLEIKGLFGQTPLIRSVVEDYIDITAILLEHGALTDRRDESGNTALMHAVEDGQIEVIKSLIFAGANVNLKNSQDQTLLQIAQTSKQAQVERLLHQLKIH